MKNKIKLGKKPKITIARLITNVAVRAFFFFLFPAVFSTAFAGIRNICTQIGSGKPLEVNSFLITLIAVLAFTVIFGRFFCGFACPFGTYGDVLYTLSSWIQRCFHRKPFRLSARIGNILRYCKYIVLAAVVVLCFTGRDSIVGSLSPWTVFSRLQSLSLPSSQNQIGILFLILISAGMVLEPRFFCRFLCPLGAVFSLLPVLPFSSVSRDRSSCLKGCSLCSRNCPANLNLPDRSLPFSQDNSSEITQNEAFAGRMGECFTCGRCADGCPKSSASAKTMPAGIKGMIWQIIKAVLLAVMCYLLTRLTL